MQSRESTIQSSTGKSNGTVERICYCGHDYSAHDQGGQCVNVNCGCQEYTLSLLNLRGEKPEPPDDLWERIDKLVEAHPTRPKDSFTAKEFQERRGLTYDVARNHLEHLVTLGKLKRANVGRSVYYVLAGS